MKEFSCEFSFIACKQRSTMNDDEDKNWWFGSFRTEKLFALQAKLSREKLNCYRSRKNMQRNNWQ